MQQRPSTASGYTRVLSQAGTSHAGTPGRLPQRSLTPIYLANPLYTARQAPMPELQVRLLD